MAGKKTKQSLEKSLSILRGANEEPEVVADNYRISLIKALNWYNINKEEKDIRHYAEQYCKKNNLKDYTYAISKASLIELKPVGVLGRLVLRGQPIELDDIEKIMVRLESIKLQYPKSVAKVVDSVSTPQPSIQERLLETARKYAADIDEQIDLFSKEKKTEFSPHAYLTSNQVPGVIAKKIGDFYKPLLKELTEAYAGKDEQLKEGYSHFTKHELKRFVTFVQQIVDDCTQRTVSARAARKPRARKQKPASQIVGKMKYMKEYPELKLKSINPTQIIGSTELWVYQPEKRKLTVYRAADGYLGVSGMSITNYDVSASETKTLRKPEEFFKDLSSTGKRAMANAWKAVKAKVSNPRARINEEMILLAVN